MAHTFPESDPESVLPEADSLARNRVSRARSDGHPDPDLLERFLRGELSGPSGRPACREIVRHLLTGCPRCTGITGRLWSLGDFPEPDGSDWPEGADRPGFI